MNNLLNIEIDCNKRHFVFGDVHGMYECVIRLLEQVNYDPANDMVYFVGDVIDRGPHSGQLVKAIIDNKWYCARGNHEQMLVNDNEWGSPWHMFHGGKQTLHSIEIMSDEYDYQWLKEWCESLPIVLEVGNGTSMDVTIIHAEWPFHVSRDKLRLYLQEQSQEVIEEGPLMWGFEQIRNVRRHVNDPLLRMSCADREGRQAMHGHYSLKEPLFYNNSWWLDGTRFGYVNMLEVGSQQIYFEQF